MKKSLRFCVLLALAAALLTVSAFADTGPKAQLKVLVKNAPEEPYYLDLLEKGDYQGHTYGSGDGDDTYSGLDWSYSEEEIAALDSELLDALRAAVPEGWHACTAQGTNGAPMWGDLIGSDAGGVRLHSRSEEHTSELQSQSLISYAVFCLKKKNSPPWNRTVCIPSG